MAHHAIDTEGADVSRCLFQMIGEFEKSQLYKEREGEDKCLHHAYGVYSKQLPIRASPYCVYY